VSAAAGRPPRGSPPRAERSFHLSMQHDDATLHLRLTGALEWGCVGRVEAAVDQASQVRASRVVVDLRELDFLDLAGLRALLRANDRARAERFELIVVRPRRQVRRIFTLTRAGKELTMVDRAPGSDHPG